jgi:hypothetical protein
VEGEKSSTSTSSDLALTAPFTWSVETAHTSQSSCMTTTSAWISSQSSSSMA